tara:strand:+ start:1082 stop:1621 length:540 start_codon:yes stop_codon:yes gene_type:complete
MQYFAEFPKIDYNITGVSGNVKEITDIWRRVKVRSKIADNVALYDQYDVPEGDSPETIAYKIYGSADYFWVICLLNNVVNRYHDWPLDEFNFQQFVKDKYDNPEAIHHYEKTQLSGRQIGEGPADYSHKIEVNADEAGAEAVSNIQHERRLQDKKRQIRVLQPAFLNTFIDEFRELIRQ